MIAVVGTLAREIDLGVVLVALVVLGGLLVASYLRTSRDDAGTTTEVAALATYLLGVLCSRDALLAAGLAIVMKVLLMSKTRIHSFVRVVLTPAEIEDSLKFLVIALVVLPLMPNRGMGPYGVLNPSRIWLIVVPLTGISWVGYVVVRVLGTRRGLVLTGLASGLVSVTAATASMGRGRAGVERRHVRPARGDGDDREYSHRYSVACAGHHCIAKSAVGRQYEFPLRSRRC